jgi:SagB-type dehydrogenase family enzyme
MRRIDLSYWVIALLMMGSLYLLVSGLIMDITGLHRFTWHAPVGYAWMALAFLHLMLSWRHVKAYWAHYFQPHPHPVLSEQRHLPHSDRPQQPSQSAGRRSGLMSALAIAIGFILGRLLPQQTTDMGLFYHQWSKPGFNQAIGAIFNWDGQPERYKTYPHAESIELPNPRGFQGLSLETAIVTRRSQRDYTNAPLGLVNLSRLLYLAQGITQSEYELRAVPSAGALYPLELYAIVHRAEGLAAGIYHYAVQTHKLERLQTGDFRLAIVTAGLGQDFLGQANVCLVISAVFQRTRWKYHERTYRYVLMEAGHLGQNLYLAATALGLGVCAIGAFLDDPLNQLLQLDGQQEAALYIVSVGQVGT